MEMTDPSFINHKPKISIIVPIYNIEQYLPECLDSIKSQTFNDWECILVDDGSTDSSPAICEQYASADSRFIVIHKKNGGVSSARNTGMDVAKAELIGFVDPDDWIEPELFEHLCHLIEEYDADVAQVGYWTEYRNRRSVKHLVKNIKTVDGQAMLKEIGLNRMPNYLWNRLHRRSIMTCRFPEGSTYEDVYVYGYWLRNVSRMVCDPTPLYHYRKRRSSIIHSTKNQLDYFNAFEAQVDIARRQPENKGLETRIDAFINKAAVNACKKIARNEKDGALRNDSIRIIREKLMNYPLPEIEHMNPKVWYRSKLLRNHPRVFAFVMRLANIYDIDTRYRTRQLYD